MYKNKKFNTSHKWELDSSIYLYFGVKVKIIDKTFINGIKIARIEALEEFPIGFYPNKFKTSTSFLKRIN